ncbi:hypothetical protein MELA_00269 [Candidatus Methylomirabilis lanthanidiphila]|uniref:DUF4280 domain-containing protein n=1 Tax=Candidatus Methylomirabilis lanthanidiphila TaxID=2211376 RepID=A0A564ZF11_9BACT|nr:hypothetical protein MELA_00269 [Candidatus Methylomirabilis lanthanidiphila]
MPGFLLSVLSQVQCLHGGQAKPTVPNPRVLVSGQPTVLMTSPYVIAGCTFPPPPTANGPCVTAQWTSGTVRVLSSGQPLLVQLGLAICAPTGTPLLAIATQPRVSAI